MAYQEPDNGTIFLRENQSNNPKAPRWKGQGTDDQGRKIDVAVWEGRSAKGPWMRLKIGPIFQPQGGRRQDEPAPQRGIDPADVPQAAATSEDQANIPF